MSDLIFDEVVPLEIGHLCQLSVSCMLSSLLLYYYSFNCGFSIRVIIEFHSLATFRI